jgi:hypothetical protein
MARYQELYIDGGEDGPHKDELVIILGLIEGLQKTIESEGKELRSIKDELRENELRQMEHRTESALQRASKDDVEEEVVKVIQLEERERMEKDYYLLLEKGMEDEKQKLEAEFASKRRAIDERYHSYSDVMSRREHVRGALDRLYP